jgi:hypothetical protein
MTITVIQEYGTLTVPLRACSTGALPGGHSDPELEPGHNGLQSKLALAIVPLSAKRLELAPYQAGMPSQSSSQARMVGLQRKLALATVPLRLELAPYQAGMPTQSSSQATMVGPFQRAKGVPAFIASSSSSCLRHTIYTGTATWKIIPSAVASIASDPDPKPGFKIKH